MVSTTLWPLYPEKYTTLTEQEAGRALGPVWMAQKIYAHWDLIPRLSSNHAMPVTMTATH
jgi:hypothetical protein